MATSVETLWYDHYQGAVYPLDLYAKADSRHSDVKSLVHLCCAYIVKDSTMTLSAVRAIPQTLCQPMMMEALLGNKDRAVEVLLSHWPIATMSLSQLAPSVFTSLLPLYNSGYLSDMVRQSLRYTTTMAHTFIESLRKRQPTHLRYLDLTGYPTAEVIIYFLASYVMLSFTETKQNERISFYNDNIASYDRPDLPTHIDPVQPMLPDDCSVLIKLDAFVTSESTHSELCKALKVSSFPHSHVKVCIGRLGATCLGEARLNILLKVVNAQHLQGLQMKYNSLTIDDIVKLSPVFGSLVNLTSLDLSCNSIYFYMSDAASDSLSQALSKMPHLVRLDLSNNRIKTKLRKLLSDIPKPLEYLRIAACGLTVSDITYLSISHHTNGLRELDISENCLGPTLRNLENLLAAVSRSLLVLEAEDCGLTEEHMPSFQIKLSQLGKLLYLNLAGNHLSSEALRHLTDTVARMGEVKVFRLSYPIDCYEPFEADIEEERKVATVDSLCDVVSDATTGKTAGDIVRLIIVELDRIFTSD